MAKRAYINNNFVDESEAVLPIGDLAIQRGYGIFDFLKVSENIPLFLEDHLDRFFFSAGAMDLPVARSREELRAIIRQLISENEMPVSGIRLTLTGGVSADGYSIAEPNLVISQTPLSHRPDELFEKGLKLITYPFLRQLPEVKTIDYIMAIRLQKLIRERGVNDVLYIHEGLITECPRTNFFLVTRGREIVTPSRRILKGVTRKKVIEIAEKEFTVVERDVSEEELTDASEAFITSTSKGIVPVVEVDGQKIGPGNPGVITTSLDKKLADLKVRYAEGG